MENPQFTVCPNCGALTLHASQDDGESERKHEKWHRALIASIAENRPDPRSAFIGG